MLLSERRKLKRRSLSSLTLTAVVFCCVSGGPFGLEPAISEAGAGLGLLLILLLPLIWALPDALTSCELAPAIPVEGGYVVWVKRAMGPFWGFLNAWWTWIYTLVDAAIYPVLFTGYLNAFLERYMGYSLFGDDPVREWLVRLAVIAVFVGLNIRGTRQVGFAGTLFTACLVLPFALMVIVGLTRLAIDPQPIVREFIPEGSTLNGALAAGLAVVMWNYLGWDALSTVAEEVDNPAKAYPRALLTGIVLVTAIYALPTIVGLAFFPNGAEWTEDSWPRIAEAVGGYWIGLFVACASLVSPLALFTASLLASSRVPFVLAEDGFLPRPFAWIHAKWGTPVVAILFSAIVFSILAWRDFTDLVQMNVIMYSAALILETSTLLILRKREPDLHRPFKIPGGWPVLLLIFVLPVGLVGALIATSIQEEAETLKLTAAAILSGPLIYGAVHLWRRRSA